MEKTITLELCRSNSLGSRYSEPTVIETWQVATEEDAEQAIAEARPNGYFVRRFESSFETYQPAMDGYVQHRPGCFSFRGHR